MADLKIEDFDGMLSTSTGIANEFGVTSDQLLVQIVDEDGEVYDIADVKFNMQTKSIAIIFNHDGENNYKEWEEISPPFPTINPS